MSPIKRISAVLLTVFVISAMYIKSPYREELLTEEVHAVPVAVKGISDYIHLKGKVVEMDRRELFPKYLSKIKEMKVSQGDTVKKGDILIRLETQKQDMTSAVFYKELKERLRIGNTDNSINIYDYSDEAEEGEEYSIVSPIDGTVMDLYCGEGDFVSGVFPCIAVSDMGNLGVDCEISENTVGKIDSGMECHVRIPAVSKKLHKGSIISVAPYASEPFPLEKDKSVKTKVLVSIENSFKNIRPGYTADVKIITDFHSDKMILPYEFIGQDSSGEYVMKITENMLLKKQTVQTGAEMPEGLEIVSGISEGVFVAENPDMHEEGEKVRIR